MATRDLVLSCISKSKILKWHIKQGEIIKKDKVLATYVFTEKVADSASFIVQRKLKAKFSGTVLELTVKPSDEVSKGQIVARIKEEQCEHNTVMKDMCCDCGADLRKKPGIPGDLVEPTSASVPIVHNIHELKVSVKEAERLARYDEQQLLKARKLVLVVDLDMTLIHTTIEPVPKDAKDIFSFTLPGHQYEYHTKLRPGARKFLESISKFYELHIFTMGSRMYAHTVASCLDPDGKFFAHRIRSRDEFINSFSKFHDLKALFPCGDHMVSIIDDREDVWNYTPNLITVKPYKYFKGGDDINDPFKPESTLSIENKENLKNGLKSESEAENISEKELTNESETDHSNNNTTNDKQITIGNNSVAILDESEKKEETSEKEKNAKETASSNLENNNNPVSVVSSVNSADSSQRSAVRTDLDDYLFYLDEILERVHFSFYSTLDAVKSKGGSAINDSDITKFCTVNTINPDVRVIVPELRRQTLKRCNMVFTGIVPTNVPLEKSKAWRTAISLGARVTPDIASKKHPNEVGLFTTHVIAARHGTHKAHKASRNSDIHLVNPSWLWCSSERWEWAEESIFPVPLTDNNKSPVSSTQSTPQHNAFEQKTKKQISPLAQTGFEIPGGYNPDNFLESINPYTVFSKQELDAMDKEVEDLMLSADDNASDGSSSEDDVKIISSVPSNNESSSKKRKHSSSSSPSSEEEDEKTIKTFKKKLLKSVQKFTNTEGEEASSSSSSSDNDGDSSDSDDSSSSSDSENTSEDEDQLGNLLEKRLSESSDK